MVVDYLRTLTGRKGRSFYTARVNLLNPKEIKDRLCLSNDSIKLPTDILNTLSNKMDRACVVLKYVYGFELKDTAIVFNVSTSVIYDRIKRSKKLIKQQALQA